MRLSHWLALVFALFGAAITGGLVVRHVRAARREAYAQTARLGAVALEAVRSLVEAQAPAGRFDELGRSFGSLVRQADVAAIVVRDRAGRRLVGRSDDRGLLARQARPGRALSEIDDGLYDVEAPVDLGRRGRGTLSVAFRTARLEARLRAIAAEGAGVGVTVFLALALSAWLVGMFAGERIERVVARIEALAADPETFRPLSSGVFGGVEVARLVEAFNRMGATLKAETVLRRELEAERRELSAMLVHDLKTPLTVIRSGIGILGESAARGADGRREHERTHELLETSTLRLQRMVEDVLQLAKLEESATLQHLDKVDMAAMAEACARDFGLVAAQRKQTVELRVADAPPRVLGDSSLLRRVLDNLVHNAVEHTPAGGAITIGVRPENGGVLVEVCDSGPGVPIEAREHVFRKFFQKDVKAHVGNVGLGLALCEKVVSRHGGAIGVGDAEPKGARFYFTLPGAFES